MRGSFEALNLFVEIPNLAERLGPRFPFDERTRFLEDPDRLREVVPLQLQIEQLAPGFTHLLLNEIRDVSLEAFRRLLADAGRGFDVPPFERLTGLAQEALRGRDIHPHRPHFVRESVPRLDGIVDDPLPFVDFESDPFRGDEEGFHLVHELRELSVEELPVPGRNPTLCLFSCLTEGIQPSLQGGTGRFRGRRCGGGDDCQCRRPSRRRYLHGPRNRRSRRCGRGRTTVVGKAHSAVGALVSVRRHGRLAHGAFVLGRGSFGDFGSASWADSGVCGDEGLADGAEELLAEFPRGRYDRSGIGSRGGLSSFWGVARDALQRFDDFPMVFLAVHDRGEDLVDAPAVPDGNLNWLLRTAREVEQGQVGLARRAHPSVRLDGRIADGTDLRFFRWRKPTPRLVDVFSILEQRTKTFGTQSRE